jgi:hypothetical protein
MMIVRIRDILSEPSLELIFDDFASYNRGGMWQNGFDILHDFWRLDIQQP